MADFLSPGLKVTEIRKGPSSLTGIQSSSVGAFLGIAKKGPIGTPQKLTSFADFLAVYGDYIDGGYLAEEVDAFFGNGGKFCYVSRAAHYTTISNPLSYDMVVATRTFADSTPTNTYRVDASSPGAWGNLYKHTSIRKTLSLSALWTTTLSATVTAALITSLPITDTTYINVGDVVRVADTVGPVTFTVTVTAKTSTTITFVAATPTGNLNAATTTVNVDIPASARTSCNLMSASRVQIGDLIQIVSGANTFKFTVTSKSGNTVYFASQNPGVIIAAGGSVVSSLMFSVIALNENGQIDQQWTDLRMSSLSTRYFADIINNAYRTPFTVTDLASASIDARPVDITAAALSAGTDGGTVVALDYIGNSGAKNGLFAYDVKSDFGLMAVPGITTAPVAIATIDYAESRKLFVAVLDIPQGTSSSGAVTYAGTTVNDYSSYACYIYPWVKITNPIDGAKISAPAAAFWMGIMARTDQSRGIWKAPAGIDDGAVRRIVGVETEVQQADYDLMYPAKINAIQVFQGQGTCVMGNITLDPTGEFGELALRRLFLYVEQTLQIGLRWVNFEPNNEGTRARVVRNIRSFLKGIWKAGGLTGATPEEAFFIICDETNNDALSVSQKKLNIRVGLAAVHASEFVDVTVEQDTRAIDAAIAASV